MDESDLRKWREQRRQKPIRIEINDTSERLGGLHHVVVTHENLGNYLYFGTPWLDVYDADGTASFVNFSVEGFLFIRGFVEVHLLRLLQKLLRKTTNWIRLHEPPLDKSWSIFKLFTPAFGFFGVKCAFFANEWLFSF